MRSQTPHHQLWGPEPQPHGLGAQSHGLGPNQMVWRANHMFWDPTESFGDSATVFGAQPWDLGAQPHCSGDTSHSINVLKLSSSATGHILFLAWQPVRFAKTGMPKHHSCHSRPHWLILTHTPPKISLSNVCVSLFLPCVLFSSQIQALQNRPTEDRCLLTNHLLMRRLSASPLQLHWPWQSAKRLLATRSGTLSSPPHRGRTSRKWHHFIPP